MNRGSGEKTDKSGHGKGRRKMKGTKRRNRKGKKD